MAKIGFEYTVMGKLTSGTGTSGSAATYTNGIYMGPNSAFNFTPNSNDVKDYGDDRVVETDTSVIDGSISVEHNELTAEQEAYMLGHNYSDGRVISNAEDIAPFIGIGFVGKSKRNGSRKYTAKFYYKAQFREPGDDNATKQDSTTFSHSTLEGNMFTLDNGDWRDAKEFDTLAAAKSWLNAKVGIPSVPSVTLSRSSITLAVGETFDLAAYTDPEGETVTWTSDDTDKATVSGGTVTAKAVGSSTFAIIFRHIVPNVIRTVVPMFTLMIGHAVLGIAGLSFLGFGVQPPNAEIGLMIRDGMTYIRTFPWLFVFPGLVLAVYSVLLNVVSDALQDRLDIHDSANISSI